MRTSRRFWVIVGIVVLIGALVGGLLVVRPWAKKSVGTISTPRQEEISPKEESTSNPNRIRILAAGDFIAHDSINQAAKKSDGTYDYMPMMQDFAPIFGAADIRFCNDANLNGGSAFGISGYPKFNSPTEFARDMGKVGCNVVNVGTNHSFDRNQAAIEASMDAWSGLPNMLAVAGHNKTQAEHDAVQYFTVKGVSFAFLAYTTYLNIDAPAQNNYGVNVYSNAYAAAQIKAAKAHGAQFILASVRWGTEYSSSVNPEQKRIAQYLADQGVDLILGHGSHVLQPVQQLTGSGGNKMTVWYSVGNFLNNQLPAETLFNGLGVIDIDTQTRQVTSLKFLPIYMHYEWSATDAAAERLLARHNIKMYLLEQATPDMIAAQQLKTTVDAQKSRLQATLNMYMQVPLLTLSEYKE